MCIFFKIMHLVCFCFFWVGGGGGGGGGNGGLAQSMSSEGIPLRHTSVMVVSSFFY